MIIFEKIIFILLIYPGLPNAGRNQTKQSQIFL